MALPTGVSRAWTSTLAIVLFCAPLVGQTHETLHSFAKDQGLPLARPLEASDGNLYGTSFTGGVYGRGSVYRLTPDGSGGWTFSTVASFRGGAEGGGLSSRLIEASDGFLYGTASAGGNQDRGTIFRVDDIGTITVIHTFQGPEGEQPFAGLVEGPGGILYGTAAHGGAHGLGTVFSVELSGANFTVLHEFTLQEGFPEKRGLILGSDGLLYGTAYYLGLPGASAAFSLSTTGVWTTLHTFGGFDGDNPEGGLVEGDDGLFYGTTHRGGGPGGTFYSIDSEGNFTVIRDSFDTGEGEIYYPGGVWRGSDGNFYGASGLGPNFQGAFYQLGLGGGLQILHEFDGVAGSSPVGGVMEASDGFFYGSTEFGGPTPYGTVFRIDTAGQHELLHSFAGAEGSHPICRLIESPAETLLGTTNTGGANGMGTAFSSSTEGEVTVFHDFAESDGSHPGTGLVDGADGFSYGVTTSGGANGQGTFFRMDATGQLFVLRDFTEAEGGGLFQIVRGSDGNFYGSNRLDVVKLDTSGTLTPLHAVPGNPYPGDPYESDSVIQGSDGDLYGTSYYGGAFTSGTVYRLTLDGATWTTLHEFTGIEGAFPVGGLIEASDGKLYGSTRNGGLSNSNGGALYRIDKSGQFESLSSFSGAGDGLFGAGLIEASDGLLYGATKAGGSFQLGTVFRLDKNGDVVVLHSFGSGPDDGQAPNFQLHEGADGLLYGASFAGGAFGGGTLFRIDPGATFPVLSVTPTSGDPNGGTSVVITGKGFQPGAAVRIGTAAAPAVLTLGASEVEVTTPILAGGSLNHIAVMNPDGTEGALSRAFFADFYDVPQTDQAHDYVEKIFRAGVTAGCSVGSYCRYADVTRAQMAVFMLRALLGNRYYPPPATGTMFSDVPADSFAAAWIEDLASRGITAGCGDGVYCPAQSIRRSQMAVFLLKTLLGASYDPPPATGTVFADVPADSFAAGFIEDLATRGISGGCLENPLRYCPTNSTSRAQMAIFLVKTFGLP